jgi:ATP-dependent RNA helicase DDX18/HAS1
MSQTGSKRDLSALTKEEKQALLEKAKAKNMNKRVPTESAPHTNGTKKLKTNNDKSSLPQEDLKRKRTRSNSIVEEIRKQSADSLEPANMDDMAELKNMETEANEDPSGPGIANENLPREYFATMKFDELAINDLSKKAIKEVFNFDSMTHIQSRTIPHLLKGRDLLGAAKTGSGKT